MGIHVSAFFAYDQEMTYDVTGYHLLIIILLHNYIITQRCGWPLKSGGDMYGGSHYIISAAADLTPQGRAILEASKKFGDGKTDRGNHVMEYAVS